MKRSIWTLAPLALLTLVLGACGMGAPLRAEMSPLQLRGVTRNKPLTRDHFKGDETPFITEEAMRRVLEAPVFLEAQARIGVVPVQTRYAVDGGLPVGALPGELATALEASGHFEIATEVSTDWPASSGIGGLRELATRYRCEYLLLYRHRFVDRDWTNGWGAMWLTLIGGLVAPTKTLETAGVLEATLFDVKSGTLLFTLYKRVHRATRENVFQNARKRRELKEALLAEASKGLAVAVINKVRRLVAARPARIDEATPASLLHGWRFVSGVKRGTARSPKGITARTQGGALRSAVTAAQCPGGRSTRVPGTQQ